MKFTIVERIKAWIYGVKLHHIEIYYSVLADMTDSELHDQFESEYNLFWYSRHDADFNKLERRLMRRAISSRIKERGVDDE